MPPKAGECFGCGLVVPTTELVEVEMPYLSPAGTNIVPSSFFSPQFWVSGLPISNDAHGAFPSVRRKRLNPDNTYKLVKAIPSLAPGDTASCTVTFPEGGHWYFRGDFGVRDQFTDQAVEISAVIVQNGSSIMSFGPRKTLGSFDVSIPFIAQAGEATVAVTGTGGQRWWFDALCISRPYDEFIYTNSGPVVNATRKERRARVMMCRGCVDEDIGYAKKRA